MRAVLRGSTNQPGDFGPVQFSGDIGLKTTDIAATDSCFLLDSVVMQQRNISTNDRDSYQEVSPFLGENLRRVGFARCRRTSSSPVRRLLHLGALREHYESFVVGSGFGLACRAGAGLIGSEGRLNLRQFFCCRRSNTLHLSKQLMTLLLNHCQLIPQSARLLFDSVEFLCLVFGRIKVSISRSVPNQEFRLSRNCPHTREQRIQPAPDHVCPESKQFRSVLNRHQKKVHLLTEPVPLTLEGALKPSNDLGIQALGGLVGSLTQAAMQVLGDSQRDAGVAVFFIHDTDFPPKQCQRLLTP